MLNTVFERIWNASTQIKKLEERLMNDSSLSVNEIHRIHSEIRRHKSEINLLEARTKNK